LIDILGQSPLFAASMSGHYEVVKCFLSSGSDINLTDINGQSPLFAASMSGHYDVVKCLLSSGADIKSNISIKLISAPASSKHSTTSEYPTIDAINNGLCPS
jgi:ankyrin repeat protein